MARGEKVVPMGPATGANRLLRFVAALGDAFRRDKPLALPVGEAFAQKFEGEGFAAEVVGIGRGVTAGLFQGAVGADDGLDPADAVEPFLKYVAGARHEVVVGPETEAVGAAQGFDGPRALGVKRVDHAAAADGGILARFVSGDLGGGDGDDLGLELRRAGDA